VHGDQVWELLVHRQVGSRLMRLQGGAGVQLRRNCLGAAAIVVEGALSPLRQCHATAEWVPSNRLAIMSTVLLEALHNQGTHSHRRLPRQVVLQPMGIGPVACQA